jgi:hypothetical protein
MSGISVLLALFLTLLRPGFGLVVFLDGKMDQITDDRDQNNNKNNCTQGIIIAFFGHGDPPKTG